MGRPKTNRNNRFELRLTDTESKLLEECAAKTGRTRTEVIVKGITLVYKELNK